MFEKEQNLNSKRQKKFRKMVDINKSKKLLLATIVALILYYIIKMNIKYTNEIPKNKKKLVTNNPVVNTVAKQLEISKAKPDKFLKSIFNEVFNRKTWGSSGDGSGPGSTLQYTFKTRNIIKEVIQKYEIKSILLIHDGSLPLLIISRNL